MNVNAASVGAGLRVNAEATKTSVGWRPVLGGGGRIELPLVQAGYEVKMTFAEAGSSVVWNLELGSRVPAGRLESFTVAGATGTGSANLNGDFVVDAETHKGFIRWTNGEGGFVRVTSFMGWAMGVGESVEFTGEVSSEIPTDVLTWLPDGSMGGTVELTDAVYSDVLPEVTGVDGQDFEGRVIDVDVFSGYEVEVESGAVVLLNGGGRVMFAVTEGGRFTLGLPAEQDEVEDHHVRFLTVYAVKPGTVAYLRIAAGLGV